VPSDCYDGARLEPDEVPGFIELPDGSFRPVLDCTPDQWRAEIGREQTAIAYHQSRVFALGRLLQRAERPHGPGSP
ncbi:MAG: hypothetical protein M3083_14220, partial [Actinomycetota bacterium]|nr:hypothetical protein [Actinomycetota bacterium]